tara:strand:+ start:656 stop:805 length:150 start_codon:yes stop_codon:yes gene_type:complete
LNKELIFYLAFIFLTKIRLAIVKNNKGMKIELITFIFSEVPNIKKKLLI